MFSSPLWSQHPDLWGVPITQVFVGGCTAIGSLSLLAGARATPRGSSCVSVWISGLFVKGLMKQNHPEGAKRWERRRKGVKKVSKIPVELPLVRAPPPVSIIPPRRSVIYRHSQFKNSAQAASLSSCGKHFLWLAREAGPGFPTPVITAVRSADLTFIRAVGSRQGRSPPCYKFK